ncbi:hypothetical protein GCM10009077_06730 [Roseibium denhamense]|uniref:DUF1127 domain-containing protein n=1 Tax=Roseibium denhamense TaxID=76305 RepID=A0ABY1N6Z4_9HYPH|nr:hypothetical protein SAMN06265374_0391 [Roseibium denhamense]
MNFQNILEYPCPKQPTIRKLRGQKSDQTTTIYMQFWNIRTWLDGIVVTFKAWRIRQALKKEARQLYWLENESVLQDLGLSREDLASPAFLPEVSLDYKERSDSKGPVTPVSPDQPKTPACDRSPRLAHIGAGCRAQ